MGTHPIFESDFDCLTDFFLTAENVWNRTNASLGRTKIMEKKQAIRFRRQTNKKSGRHNEFDELGMRDPGQKGNPLGRRPLQNSNDFQR